MICVLTYQAPHVPLFASHRFYSYNKVFLILHVSYYQTKFLCSKSRKQHTVFHNGQKAPQVAITSIQKSAAYLIFLDVPRKILNCW